MSVPAELIAVALVVESSFAIAAEWRRILVDYVGNIMRGLTDSHPKQAFRIAFITYALSDTLPSPIICRRFFTDYTQVVKAMREDFLGLGIGQTNDGGLAGMAALEGLVAGVELFHDLAASLSDGARTVNHILHIAHTSPDDSIHPSDNNIPELDQVTWSTLHEEMSKRNINYNLIATRQPLETFAQLYRSVTATSKPTSPWFPVRPNHAVLLSGLPGPPPQKPAPKRPNDATERQLEPKRARITSETSQAEPVPVKAKVATPWSAPVAPVPLPAVAPSQVPMATASRGAPVINPFNKLTPQSQQVLIQRIRVAESQLKEMKNKVDEAKAAGQHEIAEMHGQDYAKKRASLDQFKNAISTQILNAQNQAKAQENAAPFAPSMSSDNLHPPAMLAGQMLYQNTHDNPHPPTLTNQQPLPTVNPMLASQMAFSQGNPQGPPPFHNLGQSSPPAHPTTPELNSQLQKILEQRNRQAHGNAATFPSNFGSPLQRNPMSQGASPPPGVVWTGAIKWTGQGSAGKKEVQAMVSIHHSSPLASHANTWPPAFVLVPTQEQAVPFPQLQHWLSLHKPAVCQISPYQPEQDPHNAQVYQSLVGLLTARTLYATASWTLPSGAQTRNVLFFPFNRQLFGAFFPVTGIPEMPKMPPALHSTIASQLVNMSPEQRMEFANEMKRRQQAQQMAAMQKSMGMGMQNPNLNPGFGMVGQGAMSNRNPTMGNPFATMSMAGMMQQGGNPIMPP